LRQADAGWLAIGLAVEAAILLGIAMTYRVVMRRLRYDLSYPTLLAAHLQRTAIAAISPVSGPTSVYVFVRYVKRCRVPTDDALLTVALRSIAAQAGFVILLVLALAATGSAYAVPGFVALIGAGAATIVVSRPRFAGGTGWINRLPIWARRRAEHFLHRASRHQLVPRDLALPLALATAARLGAIGILYASLHALGVSASLGLVATAYCAAMIACLAVPAFQGAGVVETATAVALKHGGVEAQTAVGAALLWRLLDFWLPIGLGLLLQVGAVLARWSPPTLRPLARTGVSRPLPAVATAASRRPSAVAGRGYQAKR
jgi:phosphatidylglycerol lysyltransferase